MVRYPPPSRQRLLKCALFLGFATLLFAVQRARGGAATSYELSLYSATPLESWIALAVAGIVGFFGLAVARSRWVFRGSLVLVGLAVAAVVSMPLVRGYHFYGRNDPLSHLGFTRSMAEGDLSPFDVVYPAAHEVAVVLGGATGLGEAHSMLLVVVLIALLSVVFLGLTVRRLVDGQAAAALAAFSALLLLPVNSIGFHFSFFPFALASFYATIPVYFLVRYLAHTGEGLQAVLSRDSGLLAAVLPVVVLAHPQVMADVVILLWTIAATQFALEYTGWDRELASLPPIYPHAIVATVLFVAWAAQFPDFGREVGHILESVVAIFEGSSGGQSVQQRAASLTDIGGTVWVLGLKLFALTAVYILLSGWLVWRMVVRERRGLSQQAVGATVFLAAGSLVLSVFGFVQFFGPLGTSTYAFRHLGFVMILGTVLGAIALSRIVTASGIDVPTRPEVGAAFSVIAVILLVVSLLTVFPSPYIYKPNQHVTEAEMTGYDSAFDRQAPGTQMTGIRSRPFRYDEALVRGPSATTTSFVPEAVLLTNLTSHYEMPTYVAVTSGDVARELRAYRGVRYSSEAFDRLERTPGVNVVQTNGEFTLYYVP